EARAPVGLGVAVDGDVLDVLRLEPALAQAIADRLRREAGPVLDAPEALLLGGGDEAAVHHQAGRGVAVVGVDDEDGRRVSAALASKSGSGAPAGPPLGPVAAAGAPWVRSVAFRPAAGRAGRPPSVPSSAKA